MGDLSFFVSRRSTRECFLLSVLALWYLERVMCWLRSPRTIMSGSSSWSSAWLISWSTRVISLLASAWSDGRVQLTC